jgi:TolA-binding protein
MKRLMGIVVALLVGFLVVDCATTLAAQRHVLDANIEKSWEVKWSGDGDIHVFDFKLRGIKKPSDMDLFKTACPHLGLWLKKFNGEFPEDVNARYFHVTSHESKRYALRRPSLDENAQTGSLEDIISKADAAYKIANYKESLGLYMTVFNKWPIHRAAPYAMFMASQNLTCLHKFGESIALFKALIKKYPNSKWVPDAWLRIACITAGHKKKKDKGIEIFTAIIKKYPNTETAADSLFNIAAIHMVQEDIQQAAAEFALIVNNFPNSYRAEIAKNNLIELTNAAQQ